MYLYIKYIYIIYYYILLYVLYVHTYVIYIYISEYVYIYDIHFELRFLDSMKKIEWDLNP